MSASRYGFPIRGALKPQGVFLLLSFVALFLSQVEGKLEVRTKPQYKSTKNSPSTEHLNSARLLLRDIPPIGKDESNQEIPIRGNNVFNFHTKIRTCGASKDACANNNGQCENHSAPLICPQLSE